jgi:hypothetical protein
VAGVGWFYGAVLGGGLCCQFRHHGVCGAMVPDIEQTVMDAAQLAVRPGLDGALHHDGRCRVAGMAGRQFQNSALLVLWAIAFEPCMVVFIFRCTVAAVGADQHCFDVVGNCCDDLCICHALAPRGLPDGALYLLGQFGHSPKYVNLPFELSQLAISEAIL